MAVVGVLIVGVWLYVADRYRFGVDNQDITCLPGRHYLIDRYDRTPPERGQIYAFRSKAIPPYYKEGTIMAKILIGLPGDRVRIENDKVYVNGKEVAEGFVHAETLGKKSRDFWGKGVLGPNQYWFIGTNPRSFDSRYWGSIGWERVIGKAHHVEWMD
ncbi:signal peptidase I [Candidatus Parcubacteria bacterium]|nr:MAG: signal peptidase I [Candidatus Parcubacteria bacterium]